MRNMEIDLDPVFYPKSIAVIGASANPMKWGWIIPANIISGGYTGRLYLVNPKYDKITKLKCYPNVRSLPETVDLAVFTVPSRSVPELLEECGEVGVKAAIVIAGGFSEVGNEGKRLEQKVVNIARRYNITLIGPNTMGIYSAPVSLCALMPPVRPIKGEVSMISQSGNIGTNMLAFGRVNNVGFNLFACSGNEAMVRCEDYIEYFGQDPNTKVILAYIEGIRNGRKFMRVVDEVIEKKPIIVLKGGRTRSGAKAARSHTGVLAGEMKIYEAVFKQLGVVIARSTDEMLDLAKAFTRVPLPKGNKVGIITWGGGYGVLISDACEEAGLELAELSEETLEELNRLLPPYWSHGNPIDMVGDMNREAHFKCLEILVRDKNVDAVIALGLITGMDFFEAFRNFDFVPGEFIEVFSSMWKNYDRIALSKIKELIQKYGKPIIAVTLTAEASKVQSVMDEEKVLGYTSLERAATVLAKMYKYYEHLRRKKSVRGDRLGSP